MAQNYHFLSTPSDLPAEYGIPLRLTLAHIPERTLSLLHLHGFHTFIARISPTLIYPTFRRIFFTMSMGERDHYITQAELLHPRPDSPPLMIPPPSSSVNTSITKLRAWISSPPLLEISETPTAVESTISSDGIDIDARTLIRSYNITLPLGQHILSSPTRVLPDVIPCRPANPLTECFCCHNLGHYREDCPAYRCPHCHVSMPGHSQRLCLSTQCGFCQNWGHSNRFCPSRHCNSCNTVRHVLADCPVENLTPEQATSIFTGGQV